MPCASPAIAESASPAYRDPGALFWHWLPPHLRAAGARHGFGLREGAMLCVFSIGDVAWYGDGACILDSGTPARGPQSELARMLEEYLATCAGEPAVPIARGGPVQVGGALIPEAHFALVNELFPGATWSAPLWWDALRREAVPAALARIGGEAVALVLPIRRPATGMLVTT